MWIYVPFLLSSKVFTIPEFLERRFNTTLRLLFALATILSNIFAFLAAVLYGGGLALNKLFGWDLWFAIIILGVVAGGWAIYGGLKSVAWTDFFTIIIMIVGGLVVTVLGLYTLSGDAESLIEGFKVMIERNQGKTGIYAEAVARNAQNMAHVDQYNRLSVVQPITHQVLPWPHMCLAFFSVGIWYGILNQFMVQRVLGAKNMYHARMGLVLAGYLEFLMPWIVVMPGLILFARLPEVMLLPWDEIRPAADQGYVHLIQTMVPIGLRGVILASLFGAIQSTVNSVINSTATIFTLDIYKRHIKPEVTGRQVVRLGMLSSTAVLVLAIVLAGNISRFGSSLFIYIQTLYAFFGPPFSAVVTTGLLIRRINAKGATIAVFLGFLFAIVIKLFASLVPDHPPWIEPYSIQGILTALFSALVCLLVSFNTAPPRPNQVTAELAFNWSNLNIFNHLGSKWYKHIALWWLLSVLLIASMGILFSGKFL